MNEIIQVTQACKQYGRHLVLDSVSVMFETGKIHGLVGRNGSGKTVLFKSICGLTPLNSGQIIVRGKQVGKDISIPDSIGAIINEPGFLQTASGYRNLKMIAGLRGLIKDAQIREVMSRVGLDSRNSKWVSKYSMGMKQRLGIAQAIMENPSLLILDEPMNGLDNTGVTHIRQLLKSLRADGKTILLASHNPLDVDELCDTVHEMDAGRIARIR